jgi:hypothetical protein
MSTPKLNWADKKNSLLLDEFIAKHGAEYCMTAQEINELRDVANDLYISSKGINSNENLVKATRNGDVLLGLIDQHTGEQFSVSKITPEEGEEPTVDGIIYFQLESEFFKRNFTKINVKWFGAKGDNINDDTAALQAVLNTLDQFGGGNIVFPKGTFKITSALTVTNRYFFNISGVGEGTLIQNNGTTSSFIFTDCERFTIEKLRIEGNGGAYGNGATCLHGIEFVNSHSLKITEVLISGFGGNGILIRGGGWIYSFISCRIQNNFLDGINSVATNGNNQNGNNLALTNSVLALNNRHGLNWKAASLYVSGCDIEGNVGAGINISTEGTIISGFGACIVGNYLEGNLQGQIHLKTITGYALEGVNISGNYFNHNGVTGANALITAEGYAMSIRGLVIDESNSFAYLSGSAIYNVSLGDTCGFNTKIAVTDTSLVLGMGHSELNPALKTSVISGLFEQKGFPFTSVGKSDNFFAQSVKTGFFKMPLIHLNYIYRVQFLLETDTTDNYDIKVGLIKSDLTAPGGFSDISYKTQTVTGGGNVFFDWFLDSYTNYRQEKGKSLYLKIEITNPAGGSVMTMKDVMIEYI